MDTSNFKNLKPRLGLIISPEGLESITLIGEGTEETSAANQFCSALTNELQVFETLIKEKFKNNGILHHSLKQ